MPPSIRSNPRLLIVRLSSLGDIVHALPAVSALARGLRPEAIDWVTQPEYRDLVESCPHVRRSIPYHRREFFRTFPHWLKELRADAYDLVIDLQGLFKSALVGKLARSRHRVGPSFQREGAWMLYDEVCGEKTSLRHAVEENLDVVRHLGIEVGEPAFPLELETRTLDEPAPHIAMAPASRHAPKNWAPDNFVQLARLLNQNTGGTIYLVGSPDDAGLCSSLAGQIGKGAVNLAGTTNIVQLATLLKSVDVLIANDSGPMHLAVAAQTPVLGIFLSTDPRRHGPYGAQHRTLSAAHGTPPDPQAALEAVLTMFGNG